MPLPFEKVGNKFDHHHVIDNIITQWDDKYYSFPTPCMLHTHTHIYKHINMYMYIVLLCHGLVKRQKGFNSTSLLGLWSIKQLQ